MSPVIPTQHTIQDLSSARHYVQAFPVHRGLALSLGASFNRPHSQFGMHTSQELCTGGLFIFAVLNSTAC